MDIKETKTTTEEILESIVGDEQEKSSENPDLQDEESQANQETQNELSEEDIALLLEAGLTEQELTAKSVEEIQQLIKEKKEGQQKPSPVVITQDMAEQLGGIAKSFVGKDVTELFKALDEQNSFIGKLSARIKQLETELMSKPQTSSSEVKNKEEILGMLPPEELEKVVEKVLSKQLPNLNKLKEVAIQEQQQMIVNNIQTQLGDKYNAGEVIQEFARENDLTDEDIAFYDARPQRFIRDVVNYVKTKELSKELESIRQRKSYEEKLEIARKIRQALKTKTAETQGGDTNVQSKEIKPEYKTVKEILESL